MVKHSCELTTKASSSAFANGRLHLEMMKYQNDVRVLEEKLAMKKKALETKDAKVEQEVE